MDKKVCEGTGIVEEKSEAVTKKGDKYWKFKVNNKTFSQFEYKDGLGVSVGDTVQMYWTEKEGNYDGKAITYRNLNSIESIGDSRKSKTDIELEKENKEVNKEMGGSGGTPQSTLGSIQKERKRRIVRQAVLKAAAEFLSSQDSSAQDLILLAERLERWVFKE